MTYSICVTDGKIHGVAIATKAPTVGSIAPFLSKNGAISTQSFVSVPLGVKAVRLMDNEASVDDAFRTLLEKDDGSSVRQVHGVDKWGNTFTFTGDDCVEWYGSVEGEGYTVAGNMLAGEKVVKNTASTFEKSETSKPLAEKLLDAIQAGENAGGDKRAEKAQSAAMKIYHPSDPKLHHDLRVDDHEDPVAELRRIYKICINDQEDSDEDYSEIDLQRNP